MPCLVVTGVADPDPVSSFLTPGSGMGEKSRSGYRDFRELTYFDADPGSGSFLPGLRIRIHFIRIQHFRLNTDPDPDPIRMQGFNDQKLKKN
jgi:hypothetical protein